MQERFSNTVMPTANQRIVMLGDSLGATSSSAE
jgi:hypothetical protein